MKKLLKPIFSFIMFLSYIRGRDKETPAKHKGNLDSLRIQIYAQKLRKNWTYQLDPIFGLLNTIPPQSNSVLSEYKGDCDNYAVAVLANYYSLKNGYLFTYFPKKLKEAHTVPIFVLPNERYMTINWGMTYTFSTFNQLLEYYNKYSGSKIISKHIAQWNEKKGRYVTTKIKRYQKEDFYD